MIQFHWVNFFLPHLGRFAEMPYYKERYWKGANRCFLALSSTNRITTLSIESYFQALDEIEKACKSEGITMADASLRRNLSIL